MGLLLVVGFVLTVSTTPINDVDSYWHVAIGRQLLDRHTVDGLGTSWLAEPAPPWRTSQWLSEVGMTGIVDAVGWRGLVVARLVILAALIAAILLTTLPRRPAALGTAWASVTVLGLIGLAQDRPQTISLLFIALLARACAQLLTGVGGPRNAAVAVTCLVWAQLHPLWLLAPAAFALVLLGRLCDRRADPGVRLRPIAMNLLASLTGVLSPLGLAAFTLPLRFQQSTAHISEWRPATIIDPTAGALAVLVLLAFLACARTPRSVPWSRLIWIGAWAAFAATAFRNLGPALLLTSPVALDCVDRAWGGRLRSWSRPNGLREAWALALAATLTLGVGLGLTATRLARLDPLRQTPARSLAERLARSSTPVRVFNAYDTSGALVAFGGGKPRLAVDGRADMWGGAYIDKIIDAQGLAPGWQSTFTAFHPDAALLARRAPLAVLLVQQGSWSIAAQDDDYVLLMPRSPGARGPTAAP